MRVAAVGTYRPAWVDGSGRRSPGPDEDVVTLAVAAGQVVGRRVAGAAAGPAWADRIVLVMVRPDVLEGMPTAVLSRGLGLPPETAVEVRVGGAPAALDALLTAAPGTLVVGVDAAAGAALSGAAGAELTAAGRVDASLPMRVQHTGRADPDRYDDHRVERERGWRPVLAALGSPHGTAVAGIPAVDARRLGGVTPGTGPLAGGAAAPIFALAGMAESGAAGRLVAVDAGSGVAADVAAPGLMTVDREARAGVPVAARPAAAGDVSIAFSMPAYERAFAAKVGFTGARCVCGELSLPPRALCLNCGRSGETTPEALPRDGTVHSVVTVHTPVPGIASPYALAIVALDGVDLRVLAQVTDAVPTSCTIGQRGRLVLRRVAVREGVPDYGYAFQPVDRVEEGAA